jgi:hypothetical protein
MYFAGEFKHHPLVTTILSSISMKIVQIGNLSTNSNLHRMQTETSSCKNFKDSSDSQWISKHMYPDNSRPPTDRRIKTNAHQRKNWRTYRLSTSLKEVDSCNRRKIICFFQRWRSLTANDYVKAHWEWYTTEFGSKDDQEIPANFYGLWDRWSPSLLCPMIYLEYSFTLLQAKAFL